MVRSATKVTASLLTAATRLKVVGRAGVGVDNISLPDATRAGVVVMNTPGGNTVSTAQLALSLLCNMARGLPQADMKVKQGLWDRKQVGVELSGKTLGVIGCGRIGQVVAHTASAMGMTVLGYDPVMTPSAFRAAFPTAVAPVAGVGHIERSDLDHLFTHSDFITVHTPLTPETAGLLNDAAFAKCRKGVRVVNCARGGIVDEAALLRALESGQVAGAALDVYTSEPPKAHLSPLLAHPNLICTPHLGASTDEAQVNVARDIAVSMSDFLTSGSTEGVVNADYLSGAHTPHLRPFVSLAHSLGSMLAQLSPSPVCQVNLRTYSKDVNLVPKRRLLAASILQGILERQCPDSTQKPSLISAPLMAKDAGIVSVSCPSASPLCACADPVQTISEEEPAHVGSPYWNLVQVDVQRADGSSSSITGAVFGTVPHIVKVDYSDLFGEPFAVTICICCASDLATSFQA